MTTAWTGGQYSVLRLLVALAATRIVLTSNAPAFVHLLALVPVALLAVGTRDRIASVVLAAVAAWWWAWSMSAVLLLHAALPAAPYGSWDARGRTDPGNDWELPTWVPALAWGVLAVLHVMTGVGRFTGGPLSLLTGLLELGLVALAFLPEQRRWAWLALTLIAVANNDALGVLLVHAFAFDPGWIPASTRITPAIVFYDGACGLCERAVRFILAEDRAGAFQLAPLQSPAFERVVPPDDRPTLPDSIVVRARDGELLVRARAAIEIGTALGGLWRVIATVLMLLPPELADRAYDVVAARRRRLFAPPAAACPLVPARLRARFVPDALPESDQATASAPR